VIRLSPVQLGEAEEQLVIEVIRSGRLSQGPMVARLEHAFEELTGTAHAVAVNSGTTALVAALQVLDLRPGDEVITSPFTFAATLNAIIQAGARARFADIREDDFTLDAGKLEAAVGSRTRAILPVHLYGYPAYMPAIVEVASRSGLAIVEDAAQAHGAEIGGRPVGSFGLGCFSLYATKNVTTGEGGVITTNDAKLADRLRVLRNQGMRGHYDYVMAGHNYRMTDLQAALGIPQLRRLPAMTLRRREIAMSLTDGLQGIPGIRLPEARPGTTHVYHQYTIRVGSQARLDRDDLRAALEERGVESGVYYPRVVFDYECYRSHPLVTTDDVPAARSAANEVLSLPVHPRLTDADVRRIVDTVREVLHA